MHFMILCGTIHIHEQGQNVMIYMYRNVLYGTCSDATVCILLLLATRTRLDRAILWEQE